MSAEPVRRKNPDVAWRCIEGQAVLVHNRLGEILVLNEAGTLIWEHLEEGSEAIIQLLAGEYGIDESAARIDLDAFLSELNASGALASD